MNEIIFFLHGLFICSSALACLRYPGPEALTAFVCVQGVLANLFVTKQVTMFGLDITCTDVFIVGCSFGLNLLQEFYGKRQAHKAIMINLGMILFYLIASQIHLLYVPNCFDTMHHHFKETLQLMPRITIASIAVFFVCQLCDIHLFSLLKSVFKNRYTAVRNFVSISLSQTLDTVLFSCLALYGMVESITHVIIASICIKVAVIILTTPFITLAKKIAQDRS